MTDLETYAVKDLFEFILPFLVLQPKKSLSLLTSSLEMSRNLNTSTHWRETTNLCVIEKPSNVWIRHNLFWSSAVEVFCIVFLMHVSSISEIQHHGYLGVSNLHFRFSWRYSVSHIPCPIGPYKPTMRAFWARIRGQPVFFGPIDENCSSISLNFT